MIKETTMNYEISVSENGTLNIDLFQMDKYWKNDYSNLFVISTLHSEMIKDTWLYNDTIRGYYHKKWSKVTHI